MKYFLLLNLEDSFIIIDLWMPLRLSERDGIGGFQIIMIIIESKYVKNLLGVLLREAVATFL